MDHEDFIGYRPGIGVAREKALEDARSGAITGDLQRGCREGGPP